MNRTLTLTKQDREGLKQGTLWHALAACRPGGPGEESFNLFVADWDGPNDLAIELDEQKAFRIASQDFFADTESKELVAKLKGACGGIDVEKEEEEDENEADE